MTWLYVVRCGEGEHAPVKIGRSDNPEARMVDLQVSMPYELTLVAKAWVPASIEHELHQLLHEFHIRGEWFRPSDLIHDLVAWYGAGSCGAFEICGYWATARLDA